MASLRRTRPAAASRWPCLCSRPAGAGQGRQPARRTDASRVRGRLGSPLIGTRRIQGWACRRPREMPWPSARPAPASRRCRPCPGADRSTRRVTSTSSSSLLCDVAVERHRGEPELLGEPAHRQGGRRLRVGQLDRRRDDPLEVSAGFGPRGGPVRAGPTAARSPAGSSAVWSHPSLDILRLCMKYSNLCTTYTSLSGRGGDDERRSRAGRRTYEVVRRPARARRGRPGGRRAARSSRCWDRTAPARPPPYGSCRRC